MNTHTAIIGLEVHVELKTNSKMFCGCPAEHFGKTPNTQTCPVCLGLPGALPVANKKSIEWTILLGLALGCEIPEFSKFDRKNYFYPDLPKGYQISQYDKPLAINGSLELSNKPISQLSNNPILDAKKSIRIRRVHLEEDTGKLQHATVDGHPSPEGLGGVNQKVTLVDFNRSGVPLVEIVTEPDFRTVEEVDMYLKKLQQIIRYLGISDADMEKGTMRIEPSISMQALSFQLSAISRLPSYRVELKNINSFRFARKALEYEIKRQGEMLSRGERPIQQTRGWSEDKNATVAQREKEEAHDYRYFPEPDIPPMRWESSQLSAISSQLPELPDQKKERFMTSYGLNDYDASLLTDTRERADYFEECVKVGNTLKDGNISPKKIANWLLNKQIDLDKVLPAQLVSQIVAATQIVAMPEEELQKIIEKVIAENSKAVGDYKKGKEQALMFLVGMIMKKLRGKGDVQNIKKYIEKSLQ